MALTPEHTPVGGPVPPPEPPVQQPPQLEIDRMVDAVYHGAQERAGRGVDTREREGRARTLVQDVSPQWAQNLVGMIPERVRNMAPRWGRPIIRAIFERGARLGGGVNSELAYFPLLNQPRRGASEWIEHHVFDRGRERGRGETRSFFSTLVHHDFFKAFKQEARAGRVITPERRQEIQNTIIAEQPHDLQEVIRQERTIEDFRREVAAGRYGAASHIYDRVLEKRSWQGNLASDIRADKLKRELERNKARKVKDRLSQEAIERGLSPDEADENLHRNELLQKYLRIISAEHIAGMITRGDGDSRHQFLEMFHTFWPIEKLARDDIPLDDQRIQEFFDSIRDDIMRSIVARLEEPQAHQDEGELEGVVNSAREITLRRRVQTALNLGILTAEDLRAIDPGRHLVEEGDAISDIVRDRIEREFQVPEREGVILPEAAATSEEIHNRALELLREAWRRDIANDNDTYSNFDNERSKILERLDLFPRISVTKQKTEIDKKSGKEVPRTVTVEEPNVQPALDFLKTQRATLLAPLHTAWERLQGTGGSEEECHHIMVQIDRVRKTYEASRAQLFASTSIVAPSEIAREVMNEDFRKAVMDRLVNAFSQSYEKFARQRTEVMRIRSETYSPYSILLPSDINEVRDALRSGPAREKLLAATIQGEPALHLEEEALVRVGIFTQEEINRRHYYLRQLVYGLQNNIVTNDVQEASIREGIFTQEELDALRQEIERSARQ